ncbi:SCO6745 family protein [Marinactinospora rubrisoli]|uniref:SalK n=1 Tax=Marinactinospora rubrisoli TaxID=2715399 RepID=A0ABW2KC34_9ACTN
MSSATLSPVSLAQVRDTWQAVERVHTLVYFAPEPTAEYQALGVATYQDGYFASRSAPLGTVAADVVIAAFYSFSPELVRASVPRVWETVSPAAITAARLRGADAALRAVAPTDLLRSPGIAEAAELARRAALSAIEQPHGRPLFAAHATLDWPDEPHLVLWHAQTLLREFRGDGHLAALLTAGLDPVESLVSYAAAGRADAHRLRTSRGWPAEAWAAAVDRLRDRGQVTGGDDGRPVELTELGRRTRAEIEEHTDRLAAPAYASLGAEGCARLARLAAPLAQAVTDSGILPGTARPAPTG